MRRILPTIFLIATLVGVFSPITLSITEEVSLSRSTAYALRPDSFNPATDPTSSQEVKELYKNANVEDADDVLLENIHCGFGFIGSSSMGQCLELIFYYIPYSVGGAIMSLSARLLDITASMTLSSSLYRTGGDENFLAKSWKITRDFSNMFFILILLYIALSMILGLDSGKANPKKLIASTIIIAIVINFSFFLTTIVIDASNSLALVFYNQIVVTPKDTTVVMPDSQPPVIPGATVKERPIAQALAQAFQPQTFQSPTFFETIKTKSGRSVTMVTMLIVIGIIYLVVAYSFIVAALSFIGRLVTLWILIIFAPFAFITYIIPKMGDKLKMLGWKGWLDALMSAAFSAPIYFFFLLLISFLARVTFVDQSLLESADWKTILVVVLISALLLVFMLLEGTKFIKKGSGVIGETVSGIIGKGAAFVGGAALGVATGGVALAGQKTLGALGGTIAKSGTLQDKAATNWFARQALVGSQKVAGSSFDVRSSKLGNFATKKTGMNFDVPGTLSSKNLAGGYKERGNKKAAKYRKTMERLGWNGKKQQEINKRRDETMHANPNDLTQRAAEVRRTTVKSEEAKREAATAQTNFTTAAAQLTKAQQEAAKATGERAKAAANMRLATAQAQKASAENLLTDATRKATLAEEALSKANKDFHTLEQIEKDDRKNGGERIRSYMKSKGTGFDMAEDGSMKLNTKQSQVTVRSAIQSVKRIAGTTVSGGVVGTVVPVMGTAVGATTGLLVGVAREIWNGGANKQQATALNTAAGGSDIKVTEKSGYDFQTNKKAYDKKAKEQKAKEHKNDHDSHAHDDHAHDDHGHDDHAAADHH